MPVDRMQFTVREAELFRINFSGKEIPPYNQEGNRNFLVALPDDVAKKMEEDGWNVKWPKPGDPELEETRSPFIQVTVGYKIRPPRITMITSKGRVQLNQDTVGVLDWADLERVDLIAVASNWEVNGKTGIKAYLKTMYATVAEDELEREYGMEDDFGPGVTADE